LLACKLFAATAAPFGFQQTAHAVRRRTASRRSLRSSSRLLRHGPRSGRWSAACGPALRTALLLMDIAARRLALPPGLWARAFTWRAAPAGPPSPETPLARLRERKQLAEHQLQRGSERRAAGGAPPAASRPMPEQPAAAPEAPAAGGAPPDSMSRLLEAKRRGGGRK
jgi:hypothetical protein